MCFSCAYAQSRFERFSEFVLDHCPIDFDEILHVFDDEIPKPKEQVEQEQDVDRINE